MEFSSAQLFLQLWGCLMSPFILWYHMLGNTYNMVNFNFKRILDLNNCERLRWPWIISSSLGMFIRLISICGKTMRRKLSEAIPSTSRIHILQPSLVMEIVVLFDDVVWFCGIKEPKPFLWAQWLHFIREIASVNIAAR